MRDRTYEIRSSQVQAGSGSIFRLLGDKENEKTNMKDTLKSRSGQAPSSGCWTTRRMRHRGQKDRSRHCSSSILRQWGVEGREKVCNLDETNVPSY
ncbi:UNVERIFIED_CONTAM: hypothetical protein FKN15_042157 [Acipenser sinensis]